MKTSHSFFSSQLWWLASIHWSASKIMQLAYSEMLLAMSFKLVLNGKRVKVKEAHTIACRLISRCLYLRICLIWIIQCHKWEGPWKLEGTNGLGFTLSDNTGLDKSVFFMMNGAKHNHSALLSLPLQRWRHSGLDRHPNHSTTQTDHLKQQQIPVISRLKTTFSFPLPHLFKPLY